MPLLVSATATGVSLVPLMVIVTICAVPSALLTVKLSDSGVLLLLSAWTVALALFSV